MMQQMMTPENMNAAMQMMQGGGGPGVGAMGGAGSPMQMPGGGAQSALPGSSGEAQQPAAQANPFAGMGGMGGMGGMNPAMMQ
jgi:hypothetical protein